MTYVFIDPLAIMLIGLAMGTAIGAFYFFFAARKQYDQIKALVIPAMGIGLFDFISGFYMSFFWPMNAPYAYAYNILFGDPLLMFGLLLLIAALMGYREQENVKAGIFPLMLSVFGIYVLDGAYSIWKLNLEPAYDNFLMAMGVFIFDGVGALLGPIMYLKPDNDTKKMIYYIEWIILGIGTVFALVLGYLALYGHLSSPP
ncbi:DUF981 family protein [Cuniculiplasma sp. SKW3]|uniref:DUF981 family protein n=1 Tax=Cuniculiplasma sp. SKW3 TaxID=3400170 RepID=UPI003FD41FFD